jgi:hypothetical protein
MREAEMNSRTDANRAEMTAQNMPGGVTRRSLLAGAGIGGAALVLGQGLELGDAWAATRTAVPGGYNDGFSEFATPTPIFPPPQISYDNVCRKLRNGTATYARQTIDWATVQPTANGPFDFSGYDHMNAGLAAADIRFLPVVHGCPSWADPVIGSGGPGWGFPRDNDSAFGRFAAETLKHFADAHGNVTAVEIWNESNTELFGAVPYRKLASLINSSRDWIVDYKNRGQLAQHMVIVSGGLSLVAEATLSNTARFLLDGSVNGEGRPIPWENYLSGFMQDSREHSAYHVGIHCYDLRDTPTPAAPDDVYTGVDSSTAVMRAKQHIIGQFDYAKDRTFTRNIWVTETGCSSRDPWGLVGQGTVLKGLAEAFALRARCQAMIVHRIYPSVDPTGETPGTNFNEYNVCTTTGASKNAFNTLRNAWENVIIT